LKIATLLKILAKSENHWLYLLIYTHIELGFFFKCIQKMRVYWRKKETFGTRFLCAFREVICILVFSQFSSFMYFTIIQIQQERGGRKGRN